MKSRLAWIGSIFPVISTIALGTHNVNAFANNYRGKIIPRLPEIFSEPSKESTVHRFDYEPWQLLPPVNKILQRPPKWSDPQAELYSDRAPMQVILEILRKNSATVRIEALSRTRNSRLPWLDLGQIPTISVAEAQLPLRVLTPSINGAFEIDGKIAIFKTSDEHLYYVVPNRWMISINGVTVESPEGFNAVTRLRFLLSPSYSWTKELSDHIRNEDPLAFFVPLPKQFKDIKFEIPDLIGTVNSQLFPTDTMSIGEQIYMSVELNEEQLSLLKLLSDSNTFITGVVSFVYPYDGVSQFILHSDIWLNFDRQQFK